MNQPPLSRSLMLLAFAFPEMEAETFAKLSLGQRDRYLLQLREQLFGAFLDNTALCPVCSERIEWRNRVADYVVATAEETAAADAFEIEIEPYRLRFRLPNSLDLAAVAGIGDAREAQTQLLNRCLLEVQRSGMPSATELLPDDVAEALVKRMEALDPQAEIRIDLHCPECSHRWDVVFDIASFLWSEIDEWAQRTLQTVHRLASGYGWSERAILNLSPVRRQLYSGMLGL